MAREETPKGRDNTYSNLLKKTDSAPVSHGSQGPGDIYCMIQVQYNNINNILYALFAFVLIRSLEVCVLNLVVLLEIFLCAT